MIIINIIEKKNLYNYYMSEIKSIGFLTFLFSTLNIIYMYLMQNEIYYEVINNQSITILFVAYIAWGLMAYALKKYVIDDKNFGLESVFIEGPFLGLLIYTAINVVLLTVANWTIVNASVDILWGVLMFSMITLIALMTKSLFN